MTRTDGPPPFANKHGWGTGKLHPNLSKWLALTWLIGLSSISAAGAQVGNPNEICLPPQEPYVPSGDEEFKDFAGVISQDFERYFSELTAYFACMDATRQAVFDRARTVSQQHQAFWKRAEDLGVVEKAATGHDGQAVEGQKK